MNKTNLLGQDKLQLESLAVSLGQKAFRGRQLYRQIYRRKVFDWDRMTDLSADLRRELAKDHEIASPEVHRREDSADGTVKYLFELRDGEFIETVFIPEERRQTLCISSQVGCAVGCTFCLTAQMGFRRNLTTAEIVGQVMTCIREGSTPEAGFNIVFMGMGEPLYNARNVMKAFRLLTDEEGMNLSRHKITLSTAGVAPVLRRLKAEPHLPKIAISLNAARDEVRDRIMPINRKWNIAELLDACRTMTHGSDHRLTFEYVLLAGETDSDQDAGRLADLLQGLRAKVNLIPYNPNPGLPHTRPDDRRIERFKQLLADGGISAFVRRTRGGDISAACGQLAYLEKAETA